MDDIVHAQDTIDVTGIVAKEDTSEGCESAHHVGLERHRRFDVFHIGGRNEVYGTSRHDGQLDL